jgi:hypothetical protein
MPVHQMRRFQISDPILYLHTFSSFLLIPAKHFLVVGKSSAENSATSPTPPFTKTYLQTPAKPSYALH